MKKWINLSEINKSFIYTPARTASVLSYRIFQYFNFQTYLVDDDGNISLEQKYMHHHYFSFFSGHENYSFIMTCRNPYSQIMSDVGLGLKFDIEKIIEVINKRKKIGGHFFMSEEIISTRLPDFTIKVESIKEDYEKIPFIKNSEFEKSGILNKLIESKQNAATVQYDWKEHMTQYLADTIYDINQKYFEVFEYDKNSWKK